MTYELHAIELTTISSFSNQNHKTQNTYSTSLKLQKKTMLWAQATTLGPPLKTSFIVI